MAQDDPGCVITRDGTEISQDDLLGSLQDDQYAHLLDDPRENGLEGALFEGIHAEGSGAVFRGQFRGARFVDCTGLVFRHADLSGSTFTDCTIASADDANFTAARITGTRFGEGRHVGVTLRDALLENVSIEKSTLVSADLSEATLRGCDMKGARLRGDYRLEGARIDRCDLRYAVFSPETDQEALAGIRWSESNVDGAWFRDCGFVGNVFRDMDLGRADIASSTFIDSRFTRVELASDDALAAVLRSAGAEFTDHPGTQRYEATARQAMTVEVYDSVEPGEPPAYEFTVAGHDIEHAVSAAAARLGRDWDVGGVESDDLGGATAWVGGDGVEGRLVISRSDTSSPAPAAERGTAALSRCFAGGLTAAPTRAGAVATVGAAPGRSTAAVGRAEESAREM